MLRSIKEMKGLAIAAVDGAIGTVDDVYFDDRQWTIRYLVVDAGGWLTGRKVLISPMAVRGMDWANEQVQTGLTTQQIENSPGTDTARPVSRQHEAELHDYYDYPYYWAGPYLWGGTVFPTIMPPKPFDDPARDEARTRVEQEREQADPNLRSHGEVVGYEVRAKDDTVGHVEDFLFDDRDWSIRLLVVDTSDWWPDKSVLLAPQRIDHASWPERQIVVNLTRDEVENSPEFDPAYPPPIGPQYEIYRRFGMPAS
jgi:uncharacterized protein YrrD